MEAWWAVEGRWVCRTHRNRWSPHNSVKTKGILVERCCDRDDGQCLVGEKGKWYKNVNTTNIGT